MAKQRHYIKEWRKHRGLTQQQLAERIGCDRTLITHIEKMRRSPDLTWLELAAEILQTTPGDLIIRNPLDKEGIWSIWDTLQPSQQTQLVEIGKTLKRTGTDG